MNRPDAALTFLRRANRVDESNTIVRLNMAIALMAKREYNDAMGLLERVLRDEPRRSLPLYFMGRVHFYQKKYDEAERHVRMALAEDPGLIDGWVMLVNVALEQEDYGAAREGLENLRAAMKNGLFTRFVEDQLASLEN